MKKILLLLSVFCWVACQKVEPIQIIAPTRQIDTNTLKSYKENLNRPITMGVLYHWGQSSSILLNTPDSLDIIIVKDNFDRNLSILGDDLAQTQKEKATKVFFGFDFDDDFTSFENLKEEKISELKTDKENEWKASNERLSEAEKKEILSKFQNEILKEILNQKKQMILNDISEGISFAKEKGFDGISVELPQGVNELFSAKNNQEIINQIIQEKQNLSLIVENPSKELSNLDKANWLVFRKNLVKETFANFDKFSEEFNNNKIFVSVDFSREDLEEGFEDTPNFSVGGRPNKIFDILSWKSQNKAGVAYYHIEKNYSDVKNNVPYKTLRQIIGKHQLKN